MYRRRPKSLPCGHTACLHCLHDVRRCPQCLKEFAVDGSSLPDSHYVVAILERQRREQRGPDMSEGWWCVDCGAAATSGCRDDHTVRSLRAALRRTVQDILPQAADHLRALENLQECEADQAMAALQLLSGPVPAACTLVLELPAADAGGSCPPTGPHGPDGPGPVGARWRLEAAKAAPPEDTLLRLLVVALAARGWLQQERSCRDAGDGDPSRPKPSRTDSQSTEDEYAAIPEEARRDGVPPVTPRGSRFDVLPVNSVQVAGGGARVAVVHPSPVVSAAYETSQQPEAPAGLPELNVEDLSGKGPRSKRREKAALVTTARQQGVRRLVNVSCEQDPGWSLRLVQAAAPLLEELDVLSADRALLALLPAMPRLRRLCVSVRSRMYDADLWRQPPVLQPAGPVDGLAGGLRWLRVVRLPCETLESLLRCHADSLEQLELYVGTAGEGPCQGLYPYSCGDLDAVLGRCGLRALRSVVLRRYLRSHRVAACREQLAGVRRLLPPHAAVLCAECDSVDYGVF